jgi:hypothetical protein
MVYAINVYILDRNVIKLIVMILKKKKKKKLTLLRIFVTRGGSEFKAYPLPSND